MWLQLSATKTRAQLLEGDAHGDGTLTRSLGAWDLLAIGVGSTVGTGVFSITGEVARTEAGPAVLLCWCIGGFGCFLSALSYMELSAHLPAAGAVYAFAYHLLGEVFAVLGAAMITLEYGISASAVAANWGDKFRTLLASMGANNLANRCGIRFGPVTVSFPSLIVLLIVTAMIYVGGDLGKRFARGSSVLAVILILTMTTVAIIDFEASNFEPFIPPDMGIAGVLAGSVTTFFGFIGFDEVCCMAGEATNPRKTVPRALIGTLLCATVLPLAASLALVGFTPYTSIDPSSGFAVAFRDRGWTALAYAVQLGQLVVLFVVTYMCFLAQPRVFFALARDGLLPCRFAELNEAGEPWFATLMTGVLVVACGALLPFSTLANAISGGVCVNFNLVNCCMVVLRGGGQSCRLGGSLFGFNGFCLLTALLLRQVLGEDVEGMAHVWALAAASVAALATILCFVAITAYLRDQAASDNEVFFRVPCVPLLPCCAMTFNNVMISSMKALDFLLLACYTALVVGPYLFFTWSRRRRRLLDIRCELMSSPGNASEVLN
ncbi:unnamed protein product [Effrenium voratum]|nr:unnamed protein product [Effrenium voratum]